MRASKKRVIEKGKAHQRKAAGTDHFPEVHISGAEGLYPKVQIRAIVQEYITRAWKHPKGKPDSIVITIDKMQQKPRPVTALPVTTLQCNSARQASSLVRKMLSASGISADAINSAFTLVRRKDAMRGAALVMAPSGRRVDPDRRRGIRASRLGIGKTAERQLSAALKKQAIDTQTVREAIILASKVASCAGVVAELCISDDPDYTTGYVASKTLGYVRVPHIKKTGNRCGGRVFFLSDAACLSSVLSYLEKTPVIIARVSECIGARSIDEIIDRHNM